MKAATRYRRALERAWIPAALCCAVVIASQPAHARRNTQPWIHVYRWNGEVAVDVRNNHDVLNTSGREKTKRNETIIGEEFSIGADGWLYHPALLRFSSELGLEFNQDIIQTNANDDTNEVDILQVNFDLNLGVLPEKPYPITLFASQSHSELDAPFTERRTIDALRYGGGVHFRELAVGQWKIPSRIFYRHFDTDTSGRIPNSRERDEIEFALENETARSRTRLEYDWESVQSDSGSATRKSNRHIARADQDFYLDDGGLFSSRVLFSNDDTNDFNILSGTVNENLSLIHGPSLRSSYGYTFNLQDNASDRQISNGGSLAVTHQLYESLASSAIAGASYSDSDLGTILRANGGLAFNYTKRIPGGNFGLRFIPSYAYQEDDVKSGVRSVIDEFHAVDVLPEFELVELCVIEPTIEIRDAGTDVPLIAGQFIILPRVGDCSPTRILITDASIAAVFVSYDHRTLPARTFTTTVLTTGFNISLWEHVSFDISYADTNQDLLNGQSRDSTLSDSELLLTHLDLFFEHHRTRLEFERFRSEISPRDRFSVFHSYSVKPTRRSTLGLGATYAYDKLTDTNRETNVFALTADGTALLPYGVLSRLNFFTRYLSQNEQNSLAIGGLFSLTYQYGWLRFELQDRFTWDHSVAKENFSQTTDEIQNSFYFRISRPF